MSSSSPIEQQNSPFDPSTPVLTGSVGGGSGIITTSSSGSNTPVTLDNAALRSPSPRKPVNFIGLGVPSLPPALSSASPAPTPSIVLATYPHLAHYLFSLLQNVQFSPTKPGQPVSSSSSSSMNQHPLSMSSSGESDEEDETFQSGTSAGDLASSSESESVSAVQQTPKKQRYAKIEGGGISGVERDNLVKQIVDLLDNEEEEKVKDVLKPHMGELAKDEILMDQVCLDCMHRRRDDAENVPYAPHLTPTRARGSPNPSAHVNPLRPFTPTRVPSFRNRTPLGRPHSPSPALAQMNAAPGPPAPPSSSGHSSTESPVVSPRLLNAKAATFSPVARGPSGGTPFTRETGIATGSAPFLPSDPWKDAPAEPPRAASPFGAIGPATMSRTGSNLAIAAPLFSAQSSPFASPLGTPNKTTGVVPDDDDDDEFSPFGRGLPKLHHQDSSLLNTDAKPFSPFGAGGYSNFSSGVSHSGSSASYGSRTSGEEPASEELNNEAGAGMTPLDVLCSVFTSVPRPELEDALHRAGYDFESAMSMLVAQHTLPRSGASTPQRVASPRPLLGVGARGAISAVHHAPREGYFQQGGRSFRGDLSPGFPGARSPGGHGGKMCRYFLAGECRRSDCRFSHDVDRALCRFWLRGHCAKGPNCEFLHQLPNNLDPHALSNAMSHVEISSDGYARPSSPAMYSPAEEFPDLLASRLNRGIGGRFDPSRNRFANAVKRATPAPVSMIQVSGVRQAPLPAQNNISPSLAPAVLALPRPSQRIKLRPPTLLPTLKTGTSANEQYMSTRATSIRLGHARNACLARAADAFRRGDGAAAKRFSREGKALNQRMLNEAAEAAQTLVRDRRIEAQSAVRERDPGWSDDPSDRAERGKECAGGLGTILGVAGRKNVQGGDTLSGVERTEALLDLHTLHGGEGSEIAGQFLAELERENFRGLAYIVIGEEKHVGTQDPLRGASKVRLGTSVKQALAEWGYAWNEHAGVICVDPCRI
ncbi:hypothetical protein I316_05816 [Kwoniella heveanensis BCC8398]|uniref:C3H1-type domain-containing protein n=1 Tax=Kwoniella heveanensis BCC8398 TaxID=1296120 RepID=A0A1B9GN20_9TREE|nr:hypothetical protein I316_05816 [Kwoniella heveanensis BCC8398]